MPLLFQYLLKLSCTLALVYLFYRLVLRRLTFYSANRWYLLLYSAAAFAIPFINISRFIETRQLSHAAVVQAIPTLETYTGSQTAIVQKSSAAGFAIWDGCLMLFLAGMFVLAFRLFVQYVSYRRIRNGAQLLAADGVNLYQTAEAITPFSFGNSIFINQQGHSEAELAEIIRHEFVHVRQRHTLDIVWMELVCLLNWYNPAAWLLRHAARQNLEFIADSKVLQSGVDNKAYQYLLLKVMGAQQFRFTVPFAFSSLKKRIVMMNKLQSAKAHLVKFLFVIPLLAVLLLAFRNSRHTNEAATVTIAGLVIDAVTELPVGNVSLVEIYSKVKATADERGFFSIVIPVERYPLITEIRFEKEGFETARSKSSFNPKNPKPDAGFVEFVNLVKKGSTIPDRQSVHSVSLSGDGDLHDKMTYDAVLKMFEERKGQVQTETKLQELMKESEKPYWIVDGRSFIVSKGGSSASWDEVVDVIFVDGKKMTGEEVNKTIKRSSFTSVSALGNEAAKKKYGIDQPVFEIFIKTKPDWDLSSSAPAIDTPKLPADYKAFLKRNPGVKTIHWTDRLMIIELKSGKRETYHRNDANSIAAAGRKWGAFPLAPPPPPPAAEPLLIDTIDLPEALEDAAARNEQMLRFLRERITQLNDSVRSNRNPDNLKVLQSFLEERSLALQQEQKALQLYLQQKQTAAENYNKAPQKRAVNVNENQKK